VGDGSFFNLVVDGGGAGDVDASRRQRDSLPRRWW